MCCFADGQPHNYAYAVERSTSMVNMQAPKKNSVLVRQCNQRHSRVAARRTKLARIGPFEYVCIAFGSGRAFFFSPQTRGSSLESTQIYLREVLIL